jgi:2-haloacid dehalogenase
MAKKDGCESLPLDFSRFSVITFDCYGTLMDWETGILGAIRPILLSHGAHLEDAEILRLYGEIEAEEEARGYREYKDILRGVVRGFGRSLGLSPSAGEEQFLLESLANWQPFPDTLRALRLLKRKFKLGVISNIDDDLFAATARKLGVEFDYVITAQQARAYKPSLEIFRLAQERIAMSVDRWLHAAQSLYHDVAPAKLLGIATIWVNRPSPRPNAGAAKPAEAKADVEVSSLAAFADLVV